LEQSIDRANKQLSTTQNFIEKLVLEAGFEFFGTCTAGSLRVLPEVRDMCTADRCRSYDKSWSCPPACGSLENFEALFKRYEQCIVFQTVVTLQDMFDFEGILGATHIHDQRFHDLVTRVNETDYDIVLLSAGCCNLCAEGTCAYPKTPCCNPELMRPSMEATGLLVSEVCDAAGLAYHHGPCTMTMISCALI